MSNMTISQFKAEHDRLTKWERHSLNMKGMALNAEDRAMYEKQVLCARNDRSDLEKGHPQYFHAMKRTLGSVSGRSVSMIRELGGIK